jgi:hypothetical protein
MDPTLKTFLDLKKSLVLDTKLPAISKQKSGVPKVPKHMMEKSLEADPYKRLANSVIKELPSKTDLIERFEQFITAEEAKL